MKQKDIALIIAIAAFAGIISFVVSGFVFVSSSNRQQAVETADPISTTFSVPDSRYFNSSSIDPTQNIQIGNSTNAAPFGSGNS